MHAATFTPARTTRDERTDVRPLLVTGEVAHVLQVHPNTVRRLARRGLLPFTVGGNTRLFKREDIAPLVGLSGRAIGAYLQAKRGTR